MALQYQVLVENNFPVKSVGGKWDRLIYKVMLLTDDRYTDYFDIQLWISMNSLRKLEARIDYRQALVLQTGLGTSREIYLDRYVKLVHNPATGTYIMTSQNPKLQNLSVTMTNEAILVIKGLIYSFIANYLFLQTFAYSKLRKAGSSQIANQGQPIQQSQPEPTQNFGGFGGFGPSIPQAGFGQPVQPEPTPTQPMGSVQPTQPIQPAQPEPSFTAGTQTGMYAERLSKTVQAKQTIQFNVSKYLEGFLYPENLPEILAGNLSDIDNALETLKANVTQQPSLVLEQVVESLSKLCQIGLALVDQKINRKNSDAQKLLQQLVTKVNQFLQTYNTSVLLTSEIQPPIDICSVMSNVTTIRDALQRLVNFLKQVLSMQNEVNQNQEANQANASNTTIEQENPFL